MQMQQWFCEVMVPSPEPFAVKAVFVLWTIWKNRNASVFDSIGLSTESLLLRMDREIWNWQISQTHHLNTVPSSAVTHPNTFQTPTIFSVKIVSDGAFKASIQKGAYGVIKYDVEGRVLDGRSRKFCCRAPICAEAYGLLTAVENPGCEKYPDYHGFLDSLHGHPRRSGEVAVGSSKYYCLHSPDLETLYPHYGVSCSEK
ncbi:hypothetical protein LINPERHAP2_LOCUS27349 [Linum perenne]